MSRFPHSADGGEGSDSDDDFYDAEDGFTKAIAIAEHAAGTVGASVVSQPLQAQRTG